LRRFLKRHDLAVDDGVRVRDGRNIKKCEAGARKQSPPLREANQEFFRCASSQMESSTPTMNPAQIMDSALADIFKNVL
jgi:hypothetical protein